LGGGRDDSLREDPYHGREILVPFYLVNRRFNCNRPVRRFLTERKGKAFARGFPRRTWCGRSEGHNRPVESKNTREGEKLSAQSEEEEASTA